MLMSSSAPVDIKFAMEDQIEDSPPGFPNVQKRFLMSLASPSYKDKLKCPATGGNSSWLVGDDNSDDDNDSEEEDDGCTWPQVHILILELEKLCQPWKAITPTPYN
ncbi:hypothetical protein O6P43_001664 [Quillaja saponaria]|uniref:Uncharacterized protein n=1 Tax=Quillaja saponaria TaxID=32244 RepID=A0AAD7VPD6_QUISA|nr:hypothetical protein O6P43_001664 [Quillaja saponaria]